MRPRRSLPQFVLTMLLATLIALSLVPIANFPLTAVAQAQTREDRKAEGDRLLQQGIKQYRTEQHEAALQSLRQALAIYRAIQDRNKEAYVLMNLGNAYQALPQYEKAIAYYEQARPIFQQVKDQEGEAYLLFNLGLAYKYLSQNEKAISYFEQAATIFRQLNNQDSEADSLMNLGYMYDSLSQYEKAITYYEQARSIYQQLKNRKKETTALIDLGNAYNSISQYEKALNYYEQSLVIAREIKNRWDEEAALGSLGRTYTYLGNYARALDYQEQSLVIARELNNRDKEESSLGNLGIIYLALGNYTKAIYYFEKCLEINRETKDQSAEGISLGNLGDAYRNLGDYAKAIEYQEQSLEIARKIKDRLLESRSLASLGAVYQDLGNYAKAISYNEQTLVIAREIKDRTGEGSILGNIGLVFDEYGFPAQAIDYLKQSLAISREIGDREQEGKWLSSIAGILAEYLAGYKETMGRYKQPELAIGFYKQSVNVYESLRQDIKKFPREVQEIYTSSIAQTYRKFADLLLTQERIREAQAILELLKVQEVRSYGTDKENNSLPIQIPIHPLESQAIKTFETRVRTHLDLSSETLTAIAQPLVQNRVRIIQESNNTPSAIGNPQAILNANPNALLIQNLVVGDKLWVLWTNATGKTTAIVVPNVTLKQLNSTVQAFRNQIGSPFSNLSQLQATSTQLYNWLIPPQLQTELAKNPKQQLIFSLDHVTRYVPVAALFDGNQYLAQRYTLSNLITTDSDMTDRLSLNERLPTILALGTSKAFPGFNALPNVAAELNAIVRDGNDQGIYPGKIRLDAAFTANTLRENLNQFRVLHIATHGSFNSKSITASFLLLGDGNRLPITEIASLTNLNTIHLVVLSACETGLSGSAQDGTEISGISGYFLYRGAKAVLASLWSVNDASTSLMMQQFYKNMVTGKLTKAEALREAQLSLLQSKFTAKDAPNRLGNADVAVSGNAVARPANFSHPYYWAPFILIGNDL